MRVDDNQLEILLGQEINQASGAESDEVMQSRITAMQYFMNRPRGDEIEGRSSVQSSDVSDMVEAVLAQVMPSFAGDRIVSFEPMGEGDEEQADMESEALSQIVIEDNRGFIVFSESVKDALLQKTGITSIWVENNDKSVVKTYAGLNEIEVQQVISPQAENVSVDVLSQAPGDDGGFDLRVRYTARNRRVRVESVAPEQFLVQAGYTSIFLDECGFCAERMVTTRNEAIGRGLSKEKVNDLVAIQSDNKQDAVARNPGGAEVTTASRSVGEELVEIYRCFYRVDLSGDGISELIEAWVGTGTNGARLIGKYPAEFIPYACGTPFIVPHSFTGLSLADKLYQTQDIKTGAMRMWLDSAGSGLYGGLSAVENLVNMDDLMNPRPGRIVRVRDPSALNPLPFNDVGPSVQGILAYADQQRSERGGASLDLQNAGAQLTSDTAHGVERQYTARELLAGMITRTLAETLFRTTYLIAHRVLRGSGIGKLKLNRGGNWIETDPAQWPERNRINIKVGLSPAERTRKQAMLTQTLGYQMQLVQAGYGGIMVTENNVHKALMDWGSAGDLDNPGAYFQDPMSPEAQRAAKGKAEQAKAEQDQQAAREVALLNHQFKLQGAFTQAEQWKTLVTTQQKYYSDILQSAVEEMKAGVTKSVDREQKAGAAIISGLGAKAGQPGSGATAGGFPPGGSNG